MRFHIIRAIVAAAMAATMTAAMQTSAWAITHNVNAKRDFHCPSSGIFAHPENPRKFFFCVYDPTTRNYLQSEYSCLPKSVFDPSLARCVPER